MRTLGPYTLLRPLGVGGMGEVWAARRTALGGATQAVAIKTLLASKSSDAAARKMFLDEARLSMAMRNSNIVSVFDAAETPDGTCYLVMELVEGVDLSRLCERLAAAGEALPLSLVAYVVGELLKALAYAHEFNYEGTRRTVVHRDISPHNVMLSSSGEVKLMDFGVARLASEETSGAFVRGKLRYMPPEQLDGESRQPTVDLFAVGAVLHELIEGKKFRGGPIDEPRLIGMVARGEIPPLNSPAERVPAELEALRSGLLAPKASERIASARAAHRALSRWPGYRDARFELEELVQRFASPLELEPVGSGALVTTASVTAFIPEPTPEPTRLDPTEMLSNESATRRIDPTIRLPPPLGEDSETSPMVARPHESDSSGRARSTRLALTLAILCVGVASLGIVLGWWSDDETLQAALVEPSPADPIVEFRPESVEREPSPLEPTPQPTEPKPQPAEPSPVEPTPQPAEPSPVEPTPQPAVPTPQHAPVSKPKAALTEVQIQTDYRWASIRLGGETHVLRRSSPREASLKPGKYGIEFTDNSDPKTQEWVSLGSITVPKQSKAVLWVKDGKVWIE